MPSPIFNVFFGREQSPSPTMSDNMHSLLCVRIVTKYTPGVE